jgi:hypothetical protein
VTVLSQEKFAQVSIKATRLVQLLSLLIKPLGLLLIHRIIRLLTEDFLFGRIMRLVVPILKLNSGLFDLEFLFSLLNGLVDTRSLLG